MPWQATVQGRGLEGAAGVVAGAERELLDSGK